MYIYVFTQPLNEQDVTQGQFSVEYSWFEFKVFSLIDWLPKQGLKNPVCLTIYL